MRRLIAGLTAVAAAATIGTTAAAANPTAHPAQSPSKPVDPNLSSRIQSVNAKLDQLSRLSDQLDEQYNVAVTAVAAARRTAKTAQQAAAEAQARYQSARVQYVQAVTAQYEGGPTPTAGALLTSGSAQQYLDGLALTDYLSSRFAAMVEVQRTARADAEAATRRAAAALASARTKEAALAERRAALQQQAQQFRQLLGTLTAQQQRELEQARAVAAAKARAALAPQHQTATHRTTHGSSPAAHHAPPVVSGPVSARVQRVIQFAEAQVGKSYSYGGSGPYAYDCSGLTMAAWAQVGVHLPHSAADQYNYGTHVSYSQLQPGDLIFLYSPIGHVELYVGHDLAVSAADPAIGIVYVHPSQDMGNYTGATRLVG